MIITWRMESSTSNSLSATIRSRADRFDIEPRECRSSGRSLSPDGPSDVSLCHICIYTDTCITEGLTRGRPLCVDTGTMQSPMQFRAIQVRLVLSASDTVTVYPSPTHTRTIAREDIAVESRTNATDTHRVHATSSVGTAAGCKAVSHPLHVPCRSFERSEDARSRRGDLRLLSGEETRLLFAWPHGFVLYYKTVVHSRWPL